MRKIDTAPQMRDYATHAGWLALEMGKPGFAEAHRLCQSRYHHWDKVKYIARQRGLEPEALWTILKLHRSLDPRGLPLVSEDGLSLQYTLPDVILREQMEVDQQLAGQIMFDDGSAVTHSQRDRFVASALMEEAIASSRLEGASTTIVKAKEMLLAKREPRDRSEQMIFNNYQAMTFVKDHVNTPLSPDLIIELQRILTEKTLDEPDQCGRLRNADENIQIRDMYDTVFHIPPMAPTLPDRMDTLCRFANETVSSSSQFIHPMVRAIAIHFQLAYDHPFCDGNGRTARALFYWSMLRSKYWLFEFLPISKVIYKSPSQYGYAFQYVETDEFDLTYFLIYHARVVSQARKELVEFLREARQTQKASRHAFSGLDINERQKALLYRAAIDPDMEFTIQEHESRQAISYYTARADMVGLEQLGFLQSEKRGKKYVYTPTEKVRQTAKIKK